nr:unnamed protein product [Callosobruchus analis]
MLSEIRIKSNNVAVFFVTRIGDGKQLCHSGRTVVERCELEGHAAVFSRVKALIEDTLFEGRREWKVIDWIRDGLSGKTMDNKVLNNIRFALPSLELVKTKICGEKSYKNMKVLLPDWDICRALLVRPIQIPCKYDDLQSRSNFSIRQWNVNPTEARLSRIIANLFHLVSENRERTNILRRPWQAPTIGDELDVDLGAFCILNDRDTLSPVTREIEPAIPRADPVTEQQRLKCQRLGESSSHRRNFMRHRYLSIPVEDVLSRNDLAFGTLIHGLLKQHSNIQVALKEAAGKHPEAAESPKATLAGGSEFSATLDDLT